MLAKDEVHDALYSIRINRVMRSSDVWFYRHRDEKVCILGPARLVVSHHTYVRETVERTWWSTRRE